MIFFNTHVFRFKTIGFIFQCIELDTHEDISSKTVAVGLGQQLELEIFH